MEYWTKIQNDFDTELSKVFGYLYDSGKISDTEYIVVDNSRSLWEYFIDFMSLLKTCSG